MKHSQLLLLPLLGLGLLLWLSSCVPDAPQTVSFEGCLYGAPEPIFNEDVPGVSKHNFKLNPGKGIESFVLNSTTSVRIEQSGCDQLQQQFTFSWETAPSKADAQFWAARTVQLFGEMGQLGAPYLSFSAISDALEQQKGRLKPSGESISLQPGLHFKIERAQQNHKATLVTLLYEAGAGRD